ncbi:MAG: hypothetical protein QE273_04825, partial [Verrucomicrobiales bacterium]|nr:hypothetical protein [Verrucomicrobiales bacterium]
MMPRVRLEAWHFSGSVAVDALVILGRLEVRRHDRRRAYLVADLALDLAGDGVSVAHRRLVSEDEVKINPMAVTQVPVA